MSSILDALRKLEADKAETPAQDDLVMDNVAAERDLVGEGLMRTGTTLRITPGILIACIVGLSVLLGIGATAGIAFWWTRSAVEPSPIASVVAPGNAVPSNGTLPIAAAPVTPAPSVVSTTPSFPPPSPPVPVQPQQPIPAPTAPVSVQPSQPVSVPVPVPAVSTPVQPPQPAPPPASTAVVPQPQPANAAASTPAQVTTQSPVVVTPPHVVSDTPEPDKEPVAPKAPRSGKGTRIVADQSEVHVASASSTEIEKPVREPEVRTEVPKVSEVKETVKPAAHKDDSLDVFSLPVLKESDKARFGLTNLRVNMVRPAGKNAPYASAVINLRPVYVGERIPNTSATLVAVEERGIAIEVGDSGERFHVRF